MLQRSKNASVFHVDVIVTFVYISFIFFIFLFFFNDIPGYTDTDCHMTRLGARRYETQSMLTARTVGRKTFARLAWGSRVSSRQIAILRQGRDKKIVEKKKLTRFGVYSIRIRVRDAKLSHGESDFSGSAAVERRAQTVLWTPPAATSGRLTYSQAEKYAA